MKVAKYLLPMMVSSLMLTGVASAQTDTSTKVDTTTPNTRVEVRNEAPATVPQQQAPAPDVNVKMPDINVQAPAGTNTTKETVTEHNSSTYIHDDNDADDVDVSTNNTWIMVMFGVVALLLIAGIAMAASRRTTIID
ncbi:MAG TPA: hypothetical protein V6D23_02340 [Candidatus Obscuribacterales bacterium]